MTAKKINLTEREFVKLMIRLQDECDIHANQIATEQIKKLGLKKIHAELTWEFVKFLRLLVFIVKVLILNISC